MNETVIINNGEEIILSRAIKEDIKGIMTLLELVCYQFAKKGMTQWSVKSINDYKRYLKIYNKKYFMGLIKDQNQVPIVAKDSQGNICGLTVLRDKDDDKMWGEDADKELNCYMHHLCTIPTEDKRYSGLGQKLVYFGCYIAAKRGVKNIRFDCKTDNEGLNNFYRRLNLFKFIGSGIIKLYGYDYNLYSVSGEYINSLFLGKNIRDYNDIFIIFEQLKEPTKTK